MKSRLATILSHRILAVLALGFSPVLLGACGEAQSSETGSQSAAAEQTGLDPAGAAGADQESESSASTASLDSKTMPPTPKAEAAGLEGEIDQQLKNMLNELPQANQDPQANRNGERGSTAPALLVPQQEGSSSKIVFEVDKRDLGEIFQQEYDVDFPFLVEGTDEVIFTSLKPSCGCTSVEIQVDGKTVPMGTPIPGGSRGVVAAVFDSRKYSNRKSSTIDVRGNAANLPSRLQINSFIQPTFQVRPSVIRFGDVAKANLAEEAPSRVVKVIASKPFEIESWASLPDGFTVEDTGRREEGPKGKGEARFFKVAIEADAPTKQLFGAMVAETSLKLPLQITVQANIIGPVKYLPAERLYFNMVNQGTSPTKVVRIHPTDKELTLPEPSVEVEGDDAFTALVHTEKEGRRYGIRVQISPEAATGRHQAVLHIRWPEGSGLDDQEILIHALIRKPR
ncbi:MAG: DUF1573 domain-containing protein [Planctomycetota bacterium]|nr:MAG: DUF1573 domain-containing protein [Planctomycetota bacterium]